MPREPQLPQPVRRVLARLARDLVALDDLLDVERDHPAALSFEDLARLYEAFDCAGSGVTQCTAAVRDRIVQLLTDRYPAGEYRVVVPGTRAPLVRYAKGKKTVWQGKRLAMTLAARLADEATDRATGEIMPPAVLAERVASVIVDCAGLDTASQTWRKTSVNGYGVKAANFYDEAGGDLAVRFDEGTGKPKSNDFG